MDYILRSFQFSNVLLLAIVVPQLVRRVHNTFFDIFTFHLQRLKQFCIRQVKGGNI